jgi:hypothetical protein
MTHPHLHFIIYFFPQTKIETKKLKTDRRLGNERCRWLRCNIPPYYYNFIDEEKRQAKTHTNCTHTPPPKKMS